MPEDQNTPESVPYTPMPSTDITGNNQVANVPAVEAEPASQPQPQVQTPIQTQTPTQTFQQQPVQLEPPTQPTVNNEAVVPQVEQAPKKSRKKLIIGIIIAVLLVLIGGSSALAYVWYQNPDKVLVDSVVNAVKAKSGVAKGSLSFKSSGTEVNVTFDAKTAQDMSSSIAMQLSLTSAQLGLGTKQIDVEADSVTDKDGNLYFKISNLKKVADVAIEAYVGIIAGSGQQLSQSQINAAKTQMAAQFEPIITKLDNKWMKVSTSDYDSFSGKDNSQECLKKAIEKLQNDSAVSNELVDMYFKNKFVVVKEQLGVKDGNIGYVLDFDQDKARTFGEAAESSQFAKDVKACSSSPSTSSSTPRPSNSTNSSATTRIEVWISQWSHELKQVKVAVDDTKTSSTASFDVTSDTSVNPQIEIPSDAQPFKEVMTELQQLMMGTSGGATNSGATSSEAALREIVINQYRANNQGKVPTETEIQKMLELYGPTNNS